MTRITLALLLLASPACAAEPAAPRQVSGIYPHLAMFNNEEECGTGAMVPWAGRLWVVTYAPHKPAGSSDKLYEITPDLRQIIRPESIGGTPANRMIHRESQQLFIGPYVINETGGVRVIPYSKMFGRLTGNARHLTDPAGMVYCATMEEGLYEIDVHSLAVTELWADEQRKAGRHANLPGYHGKGLASGFGRVIYANNGDYAGQALTDPTVPSGVLAEWDGTAADWTVIRRNQFTEVSCPDGIHGNQHPATAPVWTIGWDPRSLILMTRDASGWRVFRLPKGCHSYDGAHGWNTEWPRIREIGSGPLLMTMHGTFWDFPRDFAALDAKRGTAGIRPRSNYLKVVGDFCRWGDRVVLGCDDTAKSEFLNKRKAKGDIAGPGRSQSNLWFVEPETLETLGPPLGRGAVWLDEPVTAGVPSDPYLFNGYAHRTLHLTHAADTPVTFTLETDAGDGVWQPLRVVTVPAGGYVWTAFPPAESAAWVRVTADRDCPHATAFFHYRGTDDRPATVDPLFDALAAVGEPALGGLLHARGADFKTLRCVLDGAEGQPVAYDLDAGLTLRNANDPQGAAWTANAVAIPRDVLTIDAASVLYEDARGRWRLPKGTVAPGTDPARVCREVCTERDLFHAAGTFYLLPAENAGGFAKIRPIASHDRRVTDYASYRGLLAITGLRADALAGEHVIRSEDGASAVWVGAMDDLWRLGKPRGTGGPWNDTLVTAGVPSDPYLMTGYDRKRLALSHNAAEPVTFRLEADLSGTGLWVPYREFAVPPGETVDHAFPDAWTAYWVRLTADRPTTATATFVYD